MKTKARTDSVQAMKLAPELAAVQVARGYVAYHDNADYPTALAAFGAALKLEPNDAEAWCSVAKVSSTPRMLR